MFFVYIFSSLNRIDTDEKRESGRRETIKAKRSLSDKLEFGASVEFILRQFFLVLCSTEVRSFVLIESSHSVDFALQFGKAWNRDFVGGRDFCNTFVLIRDSGLFLFVKKSLERINPSFRSNQLYKTVGLIADYFLSQNKIKFRHSFVSAQVFGLPSSTGPLGSPNKVCDMQLSYGL